ncbi:MAG: type II toxin-antitoxin system RelE/ParE family toxin [Firmicutes bacterium]|nr:type II toxin-antitoxin system RelE/ParE family toxin [Bacillota bacterium]
MKFQVILSNEATDNYNFIFDYIALDNPFKAKEFTDEILARISSLEDFPYTGNEITKNERYISKKPYKIFYTINEETHRIEITHIRHGARDEL